MFRSKRLHCSVHIVRLLQYVDFTYWWCRSVFLFSKLYQSFFGYFHTAFFKIMIVNNSPGKASDVTATSDMHRLNFIHRRRSVGCLMPCVCQQRQKKGLTPSRRACWTWCRLQIGPGKLNTWSHKTSLCSSAILQIKPLISYEISMGLGYGLNDCLIHQFDIQSYIEHQSIL